MGEVVPIIFLAVILKIPVLYGMWLIYWAVKAEPELEDAGGTTEDHTFRRWRRDPTKPKGPRRGGPHGGAAQAKPELPHDGRKRTSLPPRPVAVPAAHDRRLHESTER
jgi:hypothetical protein